MNTQRFSFIIPVNNEVILANNILKSKIYLDGHHEFIFQRGYTNVSKAYNDALPKASSDILIFCHQDVFFPDDWEQKLLTGLTDIQRADPGWGVLGVAGVRITSRFGGMSKGVKFLGDFRTSVMGALFFIEYSYPKHYPQEVHTLDEVLLIVKREHAQFDEQIPHNHFYGADLCLSLGQQGLKTYVISAYLHHNSASEWVGKDFYVAAEYMYKKHFDRLPIATTCIIIEDAKGKPKFYNDFIALFSMGWHSICNYFKGIRKQNAQFEESARLKSSAKM
ncbi:MAG: hypothetical protein KDJ28_04610 [Candidatus Competibacteraceae bacterium]|nr:hypothetical protein [Candidatus Competibacteraceae bacterium]